MTGRSGAAADAPLERSAAGWDDAAVPLETRGISRKWLVGFAQSVINDVNKAHFEAIDDAERAQRHNEAGRWGRHDEPDLPVPDIPRFSFLTTHGLVNRVIKPLTASLRAPLYAIVPNEFRGTPTTFVSHTWSSLLVGPLRQHIGTFDALEQSEHEFVWVDFACYNQHTFETIPDDMQRVIHAIGSVSVCATPTPIYRRCWCLWELLCAHRANTAVTLLVHRGYRNDKIMAVNALFRSFAGIANAQSSKADDRQMIIDACLAHFGSVESANAQFDSMIRERFAGDWYELQDKNERMRFSPTPWIAGQDGTQPQTFEPYYEPGLLDCGVFDSSQTVRELFADAGVYLGTGELTQVSTDRARAAWQQSEESTQELFRCLTSGDAAGVKQHLDRGADPDTEMGSLCPIVIAAGRGDADIVEMLIAAGADVNRIDSDLSPLRLAADKGHHEVVRVLLRHAAAVDAADSDTGWTALLWASAGGHDDIVATLLAAGADVSHRGGGKQATALHLAAQNGRAAVVRALLAHGADLGAREYRGLTALHLAASQGHADVVRILLAHGADPAAQGLHGETAHGLAERAGDPDVIEALRSGRASGVEEPAAQDPGTLLCQLVSTGQWERFDQLVRDWSFIESESANGWAVLYPRLVQAGGQLDRDRLRTLPLTLVELGWERIANTDYESGVYLFRRAFAAIIGLVNHDSDTAGWLLEFLENLAASPGTSAGDHRSKMLMFLSHSVVQDDPQLSAYAGSIQNQTSQALRLLEQLRIDVPVAARNWVALMQHF